MARFDICTPRKKSDGGTYWVKIGTAWEKDGKTQLVFDALPIPDSEGRCVASLFAPRDSGQQRQQQDNRSSRGNSRDDDEDRIPF